MWRFDLQLFTGSNNAAEQNRNANQQVQRNTALAAQQFGDWTKANPFPLQGTAGPQQPGQMNQVFGGGGVQFGCPHGTQLNATPQLIPQMQQNSQMRSPQPVAQQQPGFLPQKPPVMPSPLGNQQGGQQDAQPFGPNQHNLLALLRQHGLIQ